MVGQPREIGAGGGPHARRLLVAALLLLVGVLAAGSPWPMLIATPVVRMIILMVAVAATGFDLFEPPQRSTALAKVLADLLLGFVLGAMASRVAGGTISAGEDATDAGG